MLSRLQAQAQALSFLSAHASPLFTFMSQPEMPTSNTWVVREGVRKELEEGRALQDEK